ncbi:hypothetical protein R3P38DRAFT_3604681, partial [Favolaschia claudopus]
LAWCYTTTTTTGNGELSFVVRHTHRPLVGVEPQRYLPLPLPLGSLVPSFLVGIITDMDPRSLSSPRPSYHDARQRLHFPDPKDNAACARFRLARKRRSAPSGEKQLWREMCSLWRHVNNLSSAMLEQSHHISRLMQTLTAPPPNSSPTYPEGDRGTHLTTPAARPPPEPDTVTTDVSDNTAPPGPSQPNATAPFAHSNQTASSVPSHPHVRETELALPKLRGMFNRKKGA